jgi:hypothetical protein
MRDLRREVRRHLVGEDIRLVGVDMSTVDRGMMRADGRVRGWIWRVGIDEVNRVRFWMIFWEDDFRCPSYSSISILVFILGNVASFSHIFRAWE